MRGPYVSLIGNYEVYVSLRCMASWNRINSVEVGDISNCDLEVRRWMYLCFFTATGQLLGETHKEMNQLPTINFNGILVSFMEGNHQQQQLHSLKLT